MKIITDIKSTLTIYAVSIFTVSTVIIFIHSSLRHLYVAAESGYKSLCEYSMACNPELRLYIENAQRYQTDKAHAKK